jgi:tetratricopeptide (TPR) repeat protein
MSPETQTDALLSFKRLVGLLRPVSAFVLVIATTVYAGVRALTAGLSPSEITHLQNLISRGELQRARRELELTIAKHPRSADLFDLLGVVEAREGNFSAAESDFKRSIDLDPHLVGAYLNLGRVYQQQIGRKDGMAAKAIATYRRVLDFNPSNVEANSQLSVLLEQGGDFRSSLAHLGRLPPELQASSRIRLVRIADHAGLGNWTAVNDEVRGFVLDQSVEESDILATLPMLHGTRGRSAGIALLEALDRNGRASWAALYQLGMLYENSKQFEKARTTLEKAAQGAPNLVPILLLLARIANAQKDYKGALGYLAHARDLAPDDARVHFFFGLVCVEANLGEEAYRSLQRAVELDPQNPYYNFALGAVILVRDDPHPAITYFRKYRLARPKDPRGTFALGVAYFYSHDLGSAQKYFEEVARYQQTAAAAHYFLGRIANLEGKLDQAEFQLTRSLREDPDSAEALTELGIVRMKQEQYGAAEGAFEAALREDPSNYRANLNLMMLYERTHDTRATAQRLRFMKLERTRDQTARDFLRTIRIEREMTDNDGR